VDSYSIQQAAERTRVSVHTLRYYERIGLMSPVDRASSGHRRYSEDDLGWVRMLTLLRATGMPIAQMQRFAVYVWNGAHTIPERLALLEEHEREVVEQIAGLQRHLGALRNKIGIYREQQKDKLSKAELTST
jgi:DNA-binding transcriptional MerR regulator